MTPVASTTPKVLRLGPISFGFKNWSEISRVAEVVDCTSSNREEFFKDLESKYKDITHISRTFVSVQNTGRFDEELASKLPKSVVSICHTGAGYDQIDVDSFTKRKIQISNVTTPVEAPTADTAMFLVLATMRNFQAGHDGAVKGLWPTTKCAGAELGHEPEGKTIGIIGMGGIGRAIRDRLKPFNFGKIIYHNRSQLKPELEDGAQYVSYEKLLKLSDVICLSMPLNAKTHHIINKSSISQMKDGVIIINTARGAVVDEKELLDQLKSGKVGFYGSDVFEFEPEVPKELLELPNVVSLPHMGTHTYESISNLEEWAAMNVLECIRTGKVKTIVPEQYDVHFEAVPLI